MGSQPSREKPSTLLDDHQNVPITSERELGSPYSTEKPSTPPEDLHNIPVIRERTSLSFPEQLQKVTSNREQIDSVCFTEQPVKPLEELKKAPSNKEKSVSGKSGEHPAKPLEKLKKAPSNKEKSVSGKSPEHPAKPLEDPHKKYWVDENSGCNCFMLFARDLKIVWGDDRRYWRWGCFHESSHPDIEVAELLNVCWLEVTGKVKISDLSPGIVYKFGFVVMLKDQAYGWDVAPVTLKLHTPDGKVQESKVSLQKKPRGQWIELRVGEFSVQNKSDGEIEFCLFEYEQGAWKSGLIIQGVVIKPQ